MSENLEARYEIVVVIPDQLSRRVEVIDHLFAGLDPRSDIVIVEKKVKVRHFYFEKKGPILSVKLLAKESPTFLNGQLMESDRFYVVDQGDRLEIGQVTITIHSFMGESPVVSERPKLTNFPSLDELAPETDLELKEFKVPESTQPKIEKSIPKKMKKLKEPKPFVLHLKIISIITDFFLSYALATALLFIRAIPEITHPLSLFVITIILRLLLSPADRLLGIKKIKRDHILFSFMRKIGFLFVIFWCLLSPFFLPAPFRTVVTRAHETLPLQKTLQTFPISGHSLEWRMQLRADVDARTYFLPVIIDQKRPGFQLTNIKTQQSLILEIAKTWSHSSLRKWTAYANPLAQRFQKKELSMKELLINALTISPLESLNIVVDHGPFVSGYYQIKKEILTLIESSDDLLIDDMGASLPFIKLSNSQNEVILLITPDQVVALKIYAPTPFDPLLDTVLHHQILTQFYWDEDTTMVEIPEEKNILRFIDDQKRGNLTGLWTYYLNEAKNLATNKVINSSVGVLFTEDKKTILTNVLTALEKGHRDETLAKQISEIKKILNPDPKDLNQNDRNSSGSKNVRKSKTKNSRRR